MLCRVLKVTRAGYYAWKKREVSAHDRHDEQLLEHIREIHEDSRGVYGAPRILAVLERRGIHTSKRRVGRLMRENGLRGICRAKKYQDTNTKQEKQNTAQISDLVRRDFRADKPNQRWFADITYVKTHQGWLFLAVVFDIYSRMIVGWSMGKNMNASLVDNALKMAIVRRRPPSGLVHHSDHGSQYHSLLLGSTMKANGIIPSMGAIASPWDNAACESLMSTIKMECVHRRTFTTREEAKLEIFSYIETFYNTLRLHSALGYLSPVEYEQQNCQQN